MRLRRAAAPGTECPLRVRCLHSRSSPAAPTPGPGPGEPPAAPIEAPDHPPLVELADGESLVVYRGGWMRLLRVAVRLKVAQLVGAGGVCVPLAALAAGAPLGGGQLASLGLVAGGSAAAAAALYFYSSRYVGELALARPEPGLGGLRIGRGAPTVVRVSTLDFWGARREDDYALDRVGAPLEGLSPGAQEAVCGQTLLPLTIMPGPDGTGGGGDGGLQLVLSVRHGGLPHRAALLQLLGGRLQAEARRRRFEEAVEAELARTGARDSGSSSNVT